MSQLSADHNGSTPSHESLEHKKCISELDAQEALSSALRALGPDFEGVFVIQHWYDLTKHIPYFDWSDNNEPFAGMLPEKITRALQGVPGLTLVTDSLADLKAAGYTEGFPNPHNIRFYDAYRRAHLDQIRNPDGFDRWCLAYKPPSQPQTVFLIKAHVDDGHYCNRLDYARGIEGALERQLKINGLDVGVEHSRDSSHDGPSPHFFGQYHIPGEFSLLNWNKALRQIPGVTPRFDRHSFTIDLARLPGFRHSSEYSNLAILELCSDSARTRPRTFEMQACRYLNDRIAELGLKFGTVSLIHNWSEGRQDMAIRYGDYCGCSEAQPIVEGFSKIPELIKDPSNPLLYHLDCAQIPTITDIKVKLIPVHIEQSAATFGDCEGW